MRNNAALMALFGKVSTSSTFLVGPFGKLFWVRQSLHSRPAVIMKRVLLGSLLLLVVALQAANGMYLTMREGQAKCFIEEIPKDTLLVSNWKCEDAPRTAYNNNGQPQETLSQKSFGMTVTIKDPMDQIVYTHNHMRDDKLAFTSATGGEHTICFVTSSSTWFHAFEFVRRKRDLLAIATSPSFLVAFSLVLLSNASLTPPNSSYDYSLPTCSRSTTAFLQLTPLDAFEI